MSINRGYRSRALVFLLSVCVLVSLAGCSSENSRADRQNPFYRQGLKLQEEQRFERAAEAFERCLRHAPDSVLAHLQLAMLYEDRLDEPVRALYHYQQYLSKGGSSAPMAQESMAQLQNRLALRWAATHPSLREKLAQQMKLPQALEPETDAGTAGPTEREKHLMDSIRQLSRLVRRLQDQLREQQPTATDSRSSQLADSDSSVRSSTSAEESNTDEADVYTVQPGDTLSRIAERFYGSSALWAKLQKWNQDLIPDRNRLVPGMKLRVPSIDQLRGGLPSSEEQDREPRK
ncbi:MAG: LysM peptidoglycan-binding domain-containing protein [Verrucomicrobiota bacterium]